MQYEAIVLLDGCTGFVTLRLQNDTLLGLRVVHQRISLQSMYSTRHHSYLPPHISPHRLRSAGSLVLARLC